MRHVYNNKLPCDYHVNYQQPILAEIFYASLCRLITANFLHDSFVHLGASCYALATVAPAIEEVLGWDIFLATYLLSSVGGSVGTFILGDAVTVGASSGIFGVIGG